MGCGCKKKAQQTSQTQTQSQTNTTTVQESINRQKEIICVFKWFLKESIFRLFFYL
jgi:hypothetical protein